MAAAKKRHGAETVASKIIENNGEMAAANRRNGCRLMAAKKKWRRQLNEKQAKMAGKRKYQIMKIKMALRAHQRARLALARARLPRCAKYYRHVSWPLLTRARPRMAAAAAAASKK